MLAWQRGIFAQNTTGSADLQKSKAIAMRLENFHNHESDRSK
jgi:hypothetical protein